MYLSWLWLQALQSCQFMGGMEMMGDLRPFAPRRHLGSGMMVRASLRLLLAWHLGCSTGAAHGRSMAG
jgi:hypothetical protein